MSISESVESFTQSYAAAMASGTHVSLPECAAALGAHYGPGMASFAYGHVLLLEDPTRTNAGMESHLHKFETAGIGYDIRMVEHEILPISSSSA